MENSIDITVKTVKKIRDMDYNGKDEFFTDKKLKQFKLRKQKTKTVYIVELKSDGKFCRKVIGDTLLMTPTEARNKASEIISDIKYNIVKPTEQKETEEYEKLTLQDTFNDFLENRKDLQASTIKEYTRIMNSDFGNWLSLPLKSIKRNMIIAKFEEKSKTAKSEANRARSLLRTIFNFAEEWYQTDNYKFIQSNPCDFSKIVPFNKEKPKKRRIYQNDLPQFWKATEVTRSDTPKMAQTKLLCRLCLLTGCREQEICTLKRKNIDLKNNVILIEHTKNHNEHKIIYSKYVGELITKLCDGLEPEAYLFPANTKSGHIQDHSKYISALNKASGLSFSLHDLRRTFTTYGATFCKINGEMIKAMTNHTSTSVTFKHYVSAGPDTYPRYRKEFQKIENFVMKNINRTK